MPFIVINDTEVDRALAREEGFDIHVAKIDGEDAYRLNETMGSGLITRMILHAQSKGHSKLIEPLNRILKSMLDPGDTPHATEILSQAGFETPLNEIPAGAENPQWIQLLPMGKVKTRDDREFLATEKGMKQILASLEAQKTEAVVDFQHATVNPFVGEAPAAGWLEQYDAREDGLWGLARWTEDGMEAKTKKKYRYISPVIGLDADTREAISLHSASMVNSPAIDGMQPVFNMIPNAAPPTTVVLENSQQQENPMLEKLAATLGIEANVEAFAAYVQNLVAESAETKKTLDEALGSIVSLRSEINLRDAADVVDTAISDGKLAKSQRDWALKYAVSDNEGFSAFIDAAPAGIHRPPQGKVLTDDVLTASDKGSSEAALITRAESHMAEHNVDFQTAYLAVLPKK